MSVYWVACPVCRHEQLVAGLKGQEIWCSSGHGPTLMTEETVFQGDSPDWTM